MHASVVEPVGHARSRATPYEGPPTSIGNVKSERSVFDDYLCRLTSPVRRSIESEMRERMLRTEQSQQPGIGEEDSQALQPQLQLPTRSLLPALPYATVAATRFDSACRQVLEGITSSAEGTVESLDDEQLRGHWTQTVDEWKHRDAFSGYAAVEGVETSLRAPTRMPTAAEEREVFTRDGWRCRWCTTPVIYKSALRRMHLIFPVAFPNGYTDACRHPCPV